MLKLHADADLVFRYKPMDKTLKDYIERIKRLDESKTSPVPNSNQYPVYPEQKGEEDKPLNPYGQH